MAVMQIIQTAIIGLVAVTSYLYANTFNEGEYPDINIIILQINADINEITIRAAMNLIIPTLNSASETI